MGSQKQKVIAVISQKGGVGKSVVADELVSFSRRAGFRTAFVDLDGQGGSIHQNTPDDEDPEIVVIDTPAGLSKTTAKYAANADIIVVPTYAARRELSPLQRTRRLIDKTKKPCLFVLNRCNNYRYCGQFLQSLEKLCGFNKVELLPQAEDFIWAHDQNKSVLAYNPKGKAADAINILGYSVFEILGIRLYADEKNGVKMYVRERPQWHIDRYGDSVPQ